MSKEQQAAEIPTEAQDVYSLGALMVLVFTNISPIKFEADGRSLERNLNFFIDYKPLASLITRCLDSAPNGRPGLSEIKSVLTDALLSVAGENKKSDLANPAFK